MSIRKLIKDSLILAALMILAVFAISVIWSGVTEEIGLVIRLFILAFMITLANMLMDEYLNLSMIMSYVFKYLAISALVMLYGFIAGWFFASNFWMAFIYVGVVFILAYPIDSFRVKKDIEYINTQIAGRKTS